VFGQFGRDQTSEGLASETAWSGMEETDIVQKLVAEAQALNLLPDISDLGTRRTAG
jgi:hypothetical protein